MANMDRFRERIGAVFMPEPDTIPDDDLTPNPEGPIPGGPTPLPGQQLAQLPQLPGGSIPMGPFPRLCWTTLKQGCYTIGFTPVGTSIFGTRFRGTMRVERTSSGVRV